ncbi:hypothetical protein VE04_09031, partial [Pseudogymnoascus sp. 24MN13]
MATTQPFQKMPMNWKGLLSLPRFHRGLGKLFGVRKNLPKQIKPYAAAEGTPAAEIREVKATPDGRIVQVTILAMPQTTRTASRWAFGRVVRDRDGEREDPVTGYGKDEAGGGDYGDYSVLKS